MRPFKPFILACVVLAGPVGCDEPERPPPRTGANAKGPRSFDPERLFDVIKVHRGDARACKSTGDRYLPSLNPDDKHRLTGQLFYHCKPNSVGNQAKDWRLMLYLTCQSDELITESDLKQMGGFACKHGTWGASWQAEPCRTESDCSRTDPIKGGKRIGDGIRWTTGEARDFFDHARLPAMVW